MSGKQNCLGLGFSVVSYLEAIIFTALMSNVYTHVVSGWATVKIKQKFESDAINKFLSRK